MTLGYFSASSKNTDKYYTTRPKPRLPKDVIAAKLAVIDKEIATVTLAEESQEDAEDAQRRGERDIVLALAKQDLHKKGFGVGGCPGGG